MTNSPPDTIDDSSYFSSICIEQCKGLCCDPWWGIISYGVVKHGGLSNMGAFRDEVIKGIKARAQRIIEGYITKEPKPRPLFDQPERYNVTIRDIKPAGNSLTLTLMAMFAFRCRYISNDKVCTIHPSGTGGREIRPPHCGYMGSLSVKQGEKGYCRIIHAAEGSKDDKTIDAAIAAEKAASEKHYREGYPAVEMAADHVIGQLKDYCARHMNQPPPAAKAAAPGRNDPCHCGSGLKYKKCHGA